MLSLPTRAMLACLAAPAASLHPPVALHHFPISRVPRATTNLVQADVLPVGWTSFIDEVRLHSPAQIRAALTVCLRLHP